MSASRYARPPKPEPVLAVLLLAVWVTFAILRKEFRGVDNYFSMTSVFAEVGIVSLAMTLIIITGGIDLSVGSIVALSSVVLGLAWQRLGLGIWAAVGLAVVVGGLAGLLNGLLVVGVRIPPLIATLGTMAAYRGLAMGITGGESVKGFPHQFLMLGAGRYDLPGGVEMPGQLPLLILLAVAAAILLGRTRWGRYLYAIGLNESGARYAAVPVDGMKLFAYTLSGVLCGLAGAILTSRVSTAKPDLAQYFELDVITACVLGGVSIAGGRGTVLGSILGLFILGSIRRGLLFVGVGEEEQTLAIGLLLIAAVFGHQVLVPWIGNLVARKRELKEDSPCEAQPSS